MSRDHAWVDPTGHEWNVGLDSDACAKCGRTPDEHPFHEPQALRLTAEELAAIRKRDALSLGDGPSDGGYGAKLAATRDRRALLGHLDAQQEQAASRETALGAALENIHRASGRTDDELFDAIVASSSLFGDDADFSKAAEAHNAREQAKGVAAERAEWIEAVVAYLATDGHHGTWDAMGFDRASRRLLSLVPNAVSEIGNRQMSDIDALLATQPQEDEMNDLDRVLAEVRAEYSSAARKFAPMHGPHEGYAVIAEELDELWAEVKAHDHNRERLRDEALQVAAMAVRFVLDVTPSTQPGGES